MSWGGFSGRLLEGGNEMREDYVHWYTAKLMVEKGFDLSRFWGKWATDYDNIPPDSEDDPEGEIVIEKWSYPLISIGMALKWMEDTYGFFFTVRRGYGAKGFLYSVEIYDGESNFHNTHKSYDSCPEACEESICYCLKNLVK